MTGESSVAGDNISGLLAGYRIAVPESRQLEVFARMLEERGAEVFRCPLVAIHDSPDREAVELWLREFCSGGYDDLILLTGEGLRRLLGFAERAGGNLRDDFVAALGNVRKITRGPKPGNALREIGLKPDLLASSPTTAGVIETLSRENLRGRRIGVQLYGADPNLPLTRFLEDSGACASTVAPYRYADQAESARVGALIDRVEAGELDAIAFTSTPQVRRLFQVAGKAGREEGLRAAMKTMDVAAVGPVVADALGRYGVEATLMPGDRYFMKPLVRELVRRFSSPSVVEE